MDINIIDVDNTLTNIGELLKDEDYNVKIKDIDISPTTEGIEL